MLYEGDAKTAYRIAQEVLREERRIKLNETIGNWFVGLAIAALFIWAIFGSVINTDPSGYKQRAIYAARGYSNHAQLQTEAIRLEALAPKGDVGQTEFYQWLAQIRIARQAVSHFASWGDLPKAQSNELSQRLEAIDDRGCALANISRFNMGSNSRAMDQYLYPTLAAAKIPMERLPLVSRLLKAYFVSALLMLVLMGMKAKNRGYHLFTEATTITRLPLAFLFWPVCAWAYPYGAPIESLRYAFRFAGLILMAILSFGGGSALKAQTSGGKSGSKGKASSGWVIQSDTRWGEVVSGDGPHPQRQQRITITSPNGVVIENVTQSNNRSWNNFFSAGKRVLKTPRLVVNLLPAFRVTHDKRTENNDISVALNAQVFVTRKLPKGMPGFDVVISSTPVIQVERGIFGSSASKRTSFAAVNQTFLRSKRWNLFPGIEAAIGKATNRPVTWNLGALLEWKFPRKNWPRFGIGYLRNQAGAGVIRFRLTETFAF